MGATRSCSWDQAVSSGRNRRRGNRNRRGRVAGARLRQRRNFPQRQSVNVCALFAKSFFELCRWKMDFIKIGNRKSRMVSSCPLDLLEIIGLVGGDSQNPGPFECPVNRIKEVACNNTAALMASLWPRIRKHQVKRLD